MTHTPTPWQFWTSNSVKRITSVADNRPHQDGGVLNAYIHPSGRYADIRITEDDMYFIITTANAHDELVAGLKKMLHEFANFKNVDPGRFEALQLANDILRKVDAE